MHGMYSLYKQLHSPCSLHPAPSSCVLQKCPNDFLFHESKTSKMLLTTRTSFILPIKDCHKESPLSPTVDCIVTLTISTQMQLLLLCLNFMDQRKSCVLCIDLEGRCFHKSLKQRLNEGSQRLAQCLKATRPS